jgi:hypothetical protein
MIEQDRLGTIARKFSQSGVSNSVTDAPRFKYRGFFADGARHFLSLPILRRVVEGLSAAKLNKLHWHLADDQSFPLGACETTALFLKFLYATRSFAKTGSEHRQGKLNTQVVLHRPALAADALACRSILKCGALFTVGDRQVSQSGSLSILRKLAKV